MTKLSYIHSYDVRGVVGEDLTTQEIKNIAKAIASEFDIKKIIIGYDMRESSKGFYEAMRDEFVQYGINVVSIGLSSTPQLYFATTIHECDMGIIITASHNPSKYNGMKLCKNNAYPIAYGTGIEKIERCIVEDNYRKYSSGQGEVEEISIQEEYEKTLLNYIHEFNSKSLRKPIRIAIDYGNGITGVSNKKLLENLEQKGLIKCVHLFVEPDGTFPNHEANPIKIENLKDLQKKVVEEKCDFGISFDGDGDRVGFVDERGEYVAADVMGTFLVEHLAKHNDNFSKFCYDLRSTRKMVETGEKYSKPSAMTRVGHSHIKKTMVEFGAQFSCELSGHFYFEEKGARYDDALRATIEVICAFSYYNTTFSETVEQFYNNLKSSEINFTVEDAQEEMDNSINWFEEIDEIGEFETTHLDGVMYENDNFWLNIRKSNTEPLLRVNFEVKNKDEVLYNTIHAVVEKNLQKED